MSTQTLDFIQEAVLNFSEYEPSGTYGVTSLEKPRYQMYIERKFPKADCTPSINKIDSVIGTGFHHMAEKALGASDFNVRLEERLSADIGGYDVGGTCDLIIEKDDGTVQVGDWKTMKAFPAKKALNGETDKFTKQLSLYAYMLRAKGEKTAATGTIYVVVTGWTQRDKAIPRTFRIELELMDDAEVEAYVKERIELLEGEVKFDCPTWMCGYCRVAEVCPHNNHSEFKAK